MKKICIAIACASLASASHAAEHKTQNVFLIVTDGFRWQELFTGAEEQLLTRQAGGVSNTNALRDAFWRETPEARRAALLPFIWGEIGKHGQIYGNQTKGSVCSVTNGKKFSYPGYNEILTGVVDPRIDSNDKKPNPNVTVFEWMDARPAMRNRIAIFTLWAAFPYIFNVERSHLPIWPGWEPRFARYEIIPPDYVAAMRRDSTVSWEDGIVDAWVIHTALDYVKAKKPRLVFIGFGETDEWAHAGRYDLYLDAAHHVDDFIRRLWETVQSIPNYRGQTTFLITADHGRGTGRENWKHHGEKIVGAEGDWLAVLGPDTPPLGERTNCAPVTQNQIAATIAALLGEDYRAAVPQAGAAIEELLPKNR